MDCALGKLQGYSRGSRILSADGVARANEHTPENEENGTLSEGRAASDATFQRFCRVTIITASFLLLPKHPGSVNRSAPGRSSVPKAPDQNLQVRPMRLAGVPRCREAGAGTEPRASKLPRRRLFSASTRGFLVPAPLWRLEAGTRSFHGTLQWSLPPFVPLTWLH